MIAEICTIIIVHMKIVEEDMSKIINRLKLIYITTSTMVEHTHRCVFLQPKR